MKNLLWKLLLLFGFIQLGQVALILGSVAYIDGFSTIKIALIGWKPAQYTTLVGLFFIIEKIAIALLCFGVSKLLKRSLT